MLSLSLESRQNNDENNVRGESHVPDDRLKNNETNLAVNIKENSSEDVSRKFNDRMKLCQQVQELGNNLGLILPEVNSAEFGDVRIKNSQNVHLGNKIFYKGPVTIKQFLCKEPSERVIENALEKSNNTEDKEIPVLSGDKDIKVQWSCIWKFTISISIIGLVVLTTIILLLVVSNSSLYGDKLKDKKIQEHTIDAYLSSTVVTIDDISFVPKNQWSTQKVESVANLTLPVPYVIIIHTSTKNCDTLKSCIEKVRNMQSYHMNFKTFSDISYNFLIGGNGFVYEGRSWDKVGAHTHGYNAKSLGIAFIGNYISTKPNLKQLNVTQKLIELGVKRGMISTKYKLLGHCQISNTESPGALLYEIIKSWPHWSENP